ALDLLRGRGGAVDRVLDVTDDTLVARKVALAGLGQRQLAGRAQKQLRAHLVLEAVDALDDHRRRNAQFARGRGKASGPRRRQKSLYIQKRVQRLSPFEKADLCTSARLLGDGIGGRGTRTFPIAYRLFSFRERCWSWKLLFQQIGRD